MPKITADHLTKAAEAERVANELKSPIYDRCQEVVNVICEIFGKRLDWWHFGYGESSEISGGEFDFDWKDFTYGHIYAKGGSNLICDLKEGEEIDLSQGFPIRFLYEDFEEELTEGVAKAKVRIEKEKMRKKEKDQAAKLRKAELTASAKAKLKSVLSPEEIRALKGKL